MKAATSSKKTASKKALCVGINHFLNYPEATLNGCVADANAMSALFQKYCDVNQSEIMLLTDARANKANIMKNLSEMVSGAKSGKYSALFFSFSSHGTQVKDVNNDEADGLDEAFCPYDLAQTTSDWDRNHLIVDDELHDLFCKVPASVKLEVFLDTCHSGTGIRKLDLAANKSKSRFLPNPFQRGSSAKNRTFGTEKRKKILAPIIPASISGVAADTAGSNNQILWAACGAEQTSADAYIAGAYPSE